jgi:hypothetical protein
MHGISLEYLYPPVISLSFMKNGCLLIQLFLDGFFFCLYNLVAFKGIKPLLVSSERDTGQRAAQSVSQSISVDDELGRPGIIVQLL